MPEEPDQMPLMDVPQDRPGRRFEIGEYTGDNLGPEKREEIVALLAEGISWNAVAKSTGVCWRSVRAIAHRNESRISEGKKRFADDLMEFGRACVDHAFDTLPELTAKDAMIAGGISIEKALLLKGEATVITGKAAPTVDPEKFNEMVEKLAKASVVEAPQETGLETGENLQIEAASSVASSESDLAGRDAGGDQLEASETDGLSVVRKPESPN